MGLDINSKSKYQYRWSYGGIHYIRYAAYQAKGGKRVFSEWHKLYDEDPSEYPTAYIEARNDYKNLYWHSDCDGTYRPDGKVSTFESDQPLLTGNSVELLAELNDIKQKLADRGMALCGNDEKVFNMFYDVVNDVVTNHDGVLEFC